VDTSLRESPYVDNFSHQIAMSIGFHVLVCVVFFVRAAFVPSDELLIRNAIRVDMVDLPDKIEAPAAPEPPAQKPVPVAKTETAPPAKVEPAPKAMPAPKKVDKAAELKKIQDNQRKALERLKAQDAIDRMKSELQQAKVKPKPQTFKGNALNQGDDLTGLEKIEFDRYFSSIEKALRQNWNLPSYLVDAPLRAQAIVRIGEDGTVVSRKILTSSGNDVFDGQVLAAIDAASATFEKPPDRLKDILALKGIVFNFPD
jgi:colicin import membrane protein